MASKWVSCAEGSEVRAASTLKRNLAARLGATAQTKRPSESDDLSLQVAVVAGDVTRPAVCGPVALRGRGAPDFDNPGSPHFLKVQVPL